MRRLKLFTAINSVVVVLLMLTFAFLTFGRFHAVALSDTQQDLEKCMGMFRELLSHKGKSFRIEDGKILVGNYVINGNFEVPDKVQELFGETATVFMGDVRVSTNVRREDGSRAVGTRLEGPAYNAIFKQSKPFRGETTILGIPYFTAYDPIRDGSGKIIGAMYVGVKKSEFLAHYAVLKTQLGLILLGLVVALAVFILIFNKLLKKAETTRDADHQFLQTLIDAIPTPVYYKDVLGRYLGGNKAMTEFLGLSIDRLLGKTVREVFTPEQADVFLKQEHELIQTGISQVVETVLHADGSARNVMIFRAVFPAVDGSTGGLIGTIVDITDRKMAEESLRESERYLADIIQFFPDATLVIDSSGKVTAWNRAMEELTGVRTADMLDKDEFEYALPFYGERRPILIDLVNLSVEEIERKYSWIERRGEILEGEAFIRNRRGEELYVHGTAAPLRSSTGAIVGAIESIRDMTERKRVEDRLHKFSLAVEQSPVSIVITDTSGTIEYVNPAFTRITHYTSDEAIGSNPRLLQSGQTAPAVYAELWHTITSGREWHGVWCDKKKSGELFWESVIIFPISDTAGAITSYMAIKEDITERKRVVDALSASQERFRTLVETTSDFVWELDVNGTYTYASPRVRELLGYEPEEVVGRNIIDLMPPEEAERIERIREAILAEPLPFGALESVQQHRDGRLIVLESSGVPYFAEDGNLKGYRGIDRDITGRKHTEEELREKEEKLRTITTTAQDAIVMIDDSGSVTFWNPAAENIFGYSSSEIMGRDLHAFLAPPREYEAYRNKSKHFRETGLGAVVGRTLELNAVGKGGVDLVVELSLAAIQLRGKWHAVGVIRDISRRKNMERELQQAKEAAEAASRLKSEFLANMSHEIRTPMNGVIGMAELLMDTGLTHEQSEFVRAVQSSADSLLSVINDILDFSKIEARKLELEAIDFKLRSSLGNILHTLAFRASEKGLELAFRVPPDVPNTLVGDPGRLRQVIVNLVANAIKFTEQGEVVVSVSAAEVTETEVLLHFSVVDTGIGIARDKQESIFESFFQADTTTTRKYGGTGLGLTISARLVELMGGHIWVESEPGAGSTFNFTARFELQKDGVVRVIPEKPDFIQNLKVLVVDDNATNRRILEEMLINWRMRPFTADGGQKALQMMAAAREAGEPYRLFLLDVSMPGMDGFELVQKIKDSPDAHGATIMMLTAVGQRGDAARCRELGVSAYLTKPIGQSSLLDAILTVLGKNVAENAVPSLVTIHSLRENERPLRILLAEDNPINQKIAVRMLEKLGHTVIVAENGREAVIAFASQDENLFDLVLMDVQMPELDGFETTGLIRREEKRRGGHIPIIALTAHAMKGDREKCLQAGMDGYVVKPLKSDELCAAINGVVIAQPGPEAGNKHYHINSEDVFDCQETMKRLDGDGELFREVVGIFLADYPKQMAEIQDAIREKNAPRLNRIAHALKGAAGNFSAHSVCDAAGKLELLGKEGDMIAAEKAFDDLKKQIQRLNRSLYAYVGGNRT